MNDLEPQLADVVGHFSNSEDAGASSSWSEGAGVARVPDVGGVGGDGGPTGGGGDDAADPEARGTGARGRPTFTAALGGGEAGPVGGGGGGADALVVGKLNDVEQGENLCAGNKKEYYFMSNLLLSLSEQQESIKRTVRQRMVDVLMMPASEVMTIVRENFI